LEATGEKVRDQLPSGQSRARVFAILSIPDEIERMRQFSELLPHVNAENWREVFAAFRTQEEKLGRSHEREMEYLIQHLGRVAGRAVLEETLESGGVIPKHQAHSLVEGWASVDPTAAIEWYRSRSKEHQKLVRQGVALGLGRTDPQRAIDFLSDQPGVSWDPIAQGLITRAVTKGGFREGEEFYSVLRSNPKVPPEAVSSAFYKLAERRVTMGASQRDAAGMLEWLNPHFATQSKNGGYHLLVAAVRIDPLLTISWLDAREDGPEMPDYIYPGVADAWNMNAPEDFIAWVKANPDHPQRDKMTYSVAMGLIAHSFPAEATVLMDLLGDTALRAKAQARLEEKRPANVAK
jgi:hypothetical protein